EFARYRTRVHHHTFETRREAAHLQAYCLWLVEPTLAARAPRPGPSSAGCRTIDRLGRPACRAARLPERILDRCRCRDRGRPGGPTGCTLCSFPRAPGWCSWGTSAHPGERTDRPRLQRARLLGYRDLCLASVDANPPARRR